MVSNYEHELAIDILAQECIEGRYGNGRLREKALGELYYPVQSRVNDILAKRIDSTKTECMRALERLTEKVDAYYISAKEAGETIRQMQEGIADVSIKLKDVRNNMIRF